MSLIKWCFMLLLVLWGTMPLFSQPQNVASEETVLQNDPIVEMLDSLITLNNVIRFNNQSSYGSGVTAGKASVPEYSDEIYTQRIEKIYSPIPLVYNKEVKRYIDLYAYHRRELTSRVLGLSNLYFPLFEEILDKEGLPLEFKYLSVVESALNPVAVSRVGATGLWQFMYNTGKMYDLKINSYYDERRDPVKASYAACKYFKDMYAIYGDWLLVIAAYNCGPGNVNKAIKRSGGKKDFWSIARFLPAETRGYVPAFIAVTYVMNYSSEHQIFPIAPAYNYFEVDTVAIDGGISLRKISDAIDLPLDVVTYLNPIYKRGVIPDTEKSNYLRLPVSKVGAFIATEQTLYDPVSAPSEPQITLVSDIGSSLQADSGALSEDDNSEISADGKYKLIRKKVKKNYTVKSGDNLSILSKRFNCSVTELKSWNKLHSTSILKGQRLNYYSQVTVKVPITNVEMAAKVDSGPLQIAKSSDPADTTIDSPVVLAKAVPPPNQQEIIYHMVQKGDTLWNIAQRYEGATVEQIMKINRINSITNLKPGTKLKVKVNG
ncbi:MAG: transglycosylase SLT domain-containing protein [Bacteroidetes bacterium]|nr:transglycosylase SLT domain-containing protein [Bacteroidota bacterium]